MSQIKQVAQTLKQLLRQQKLTYKDVASYLNLSEANVKRVFATQNFSLQRLEQICELLNIELTDLFALTEKQQEQLSELNLEQEQQLVDDPKLLLMAVCIRDGWTFDEITGHYAIEQLEGIRLMAKLDKLKIIQMLPNNNYKSLIAQDFRWQKNGPLERFMENEVMTKFMANKFNGEDCSRFYLRGRYSQTSIEYIQKKLNQLTKEAAQLNIEDASLPLNKRKHMGFLFAMRPWEPSLFEQFRRLEDAQC